MKFEILAVIVVSILASVLLPSASAYSIDFEKCANSAGHHCYTYVPFSNQVSPGSKPTWNFDLFLPDGTCNISGVFTPQGGCTSPSLVLSDGNWTQLKMNPGIMSVQNIFTVTAPPNKNYCPVGLYTLTHQDGYLYKLYNKTKGLDLTGYMYPPFCHIETGPNPINGDNIIVPVPEFGPTAALILTIAIVSIIVVNTKRKI